MSLTHLEQITITNKDKLYSGYALLNEINYPSDYQEINNHRELVLTPQSDFTYNNFSVNESSSQFVFIPGEYYQIFFSAMNISRTVDFKVYLRDTVQTTPQTQKYYVGKFHFESGMDNYQQGIINFCIDDMLLPFDVKSISFEIQRKSFEDDRILDFDELIIYRLNNLLKNYTGIREMEVFVPNQQLIMSNIELGLIVNTEFFNIPVYSYTQNIKRKGLVISEDMGVTIYNLSPYLIYTGPGPQQPEVDDNASAIANSSSNFYYIMRDIDEHEEEFVLAYINIRY